MHKKILIIAPNWIGDMVMAQTLFKIIKQQSPESIIHVIAPVWVLPVIAFMPEVNQTFENPFKHGELKIIARYKLAQKLKSQKYDQALILPNSFKSALIPYFAKIPIRTGWLGEMRFGLINDVRKLNKNKLPLMVQRFAALGMDKNMELPKNLPFPKLNMDSKHTENNLAKTKILALCPGAEYGQSKRWLPEYFAEIAKQKILDDWKIHIFGSEKEQEISNQIQKLTQNKCQDFTGKLTLANAIKKLSLAKVVLANDTGLMHISAALDKQLVVLYGSTPPNLAPPLSNKSCSLSLNLPCSPCFKRTCQLKHHKCMRDLKPDMVIKKIPA